MQCVIGLASFAHVLVVALLAVFDSGVALEAFLLILACLVGDDGFILVGIDASGFDDE